MVAPIAIAGVGAAAGLAGAALNDRAARKEAKRKQAALDRWLAERRRLAKAQSDSYWSEGLDQQRGLSTHLQDLGSGAALQEAQAAVPDAVVAAPTREGGDPFTQAYNAQAGADTSLANAGLAAETAALRRRRFLQAIDRRADASGAPARWKSPTYSRQRFLNTMAANDADAAFQRDYGDTPNSVRNQQMLASLLGGLGGTTMTVAGRM